MPTIKELKEHIKDMPDDEPVHYILGLKEDLDMENFHGVVYRPTLEQASSILDSLHHNHSCSYGTTWEHINQEVEEEMGQCNVL